MHAVLNYLPVPGSEASVLLSGRGRSCDVPPAADSEGPLVLLLPLGDTGCPVPSRKLILAGLNNKDSATLTLCGGCSGSSPEPLSCLSPRLERMRLPPAHAAVVQTHRDTCNGLQAAAVAIMPGCFLCMPDAHLVLLHKLLQRCSTGDCCGGKHCQLAYTPRVQVVLLYI